MHIRQQSLAGFAVCCHGLFPFFHDYILLSSAKISSCNFLSFLLTFCFVLLEHLDSRLKGLNKKKEKEIARLLVMVASLSKQPQTLTSKPARRLVYRLSRGSRYFVKLLPIDNTAAD